MSITPAATKSSVPSHRPLRACLARQLTLGVGPMSANCVRAAIEIANEHDITLTLIASRRQIDAGFLGGGYVGGWNTREFVRYVRGLACDGSIILGRDHGGPWQGTGEKGFNFEGAMSAARSSFAEDIDSGMELIHIDPVCRLEVGGDDPVKNYVARTVELYSFCHEHAQRQGRAVEFEVGTELGVIGELTTDQFCEMVQLLLDALAARNLPSPAFVVVPTGTHVLEMRNIGFLSNGEEDPSWFMRVANVRRAIAFCHDRGLLTKAHNSDYLTRSSLELLARMKIDAVNVAPEFGVVESRALLAMMNRLGLEKMSEDFIALALSSKCWEKWMGPGSTSAMIDRATIAGHYNFSKPEFIAIKSAVARAAHQKGVDLDQYLQQALRRSIFSYLDGLGVGLRLRNRPMVGGAARHR